jgi:amphi-Trp domain-containing protein
MSDEEYETEREMSRAEIADVFESFTEGLRDEDEITLAVGGEEVHINPPDSLEFEVEVEEDSSVVGAASREVEFEIEWKRQDDERDLTE